MIFVGYSSRSTYFQDLPEIVAFGALGSSCSPREYIHVSAGQFLALILFVSAVVPDSRWFPRA